MVGVDVTVDHIPVADVPAAIAAEIQSGQPEHDLMQYIAVLSQHEPSVVDMTDVVTEAESRYEGDVGPDPQVLVKPQHREVLRLCPGVGAW